MANLEKHKKDLKREWLVDEEGTVTAQARSSRVVGASAKVSNVKKVASLPVQPAPKPDLALMREPAPPPRLEEKHSQASSPEHLRKLQRLTKLRAPITHKAANPAPRTAGR